MIFDRTKHTILLLLSFLFSVSCFAQRHKDSVTKHDYIQFTGIVVTSDSILPIPFVHIIVQNKPYGDYSDFSGKFSFVAEKGDTVVFSHIEYKKSYFVIPDSLTDFKYHIIQSLTADTIYLDGIVVSPVPNRNTFDQFFLTADIPQDKLDIAKKNLEREAYKDAAFRMGMDEKENYQAYIRYQNQKQYYKGTVPSITLMNPFAWAQFFEAWNRGDYKRHKTTENKNKKPDNKKDEKK